MPNNKHQPVCVDCYTKADLQQFLACFGPYLELSPPLRLSYSIDPDGYGRVRVDPVPTNEHNNQGANK